MPPKRKRVDADTKDVPTTRTTRSSGRTTSKSTSNGFGTVNAAVQDNTVDELDVIAPPTKKPRATTNASSSKLKASTTRGKTKAVNAPTNEIGHDEEPAIKSSKKSKLKDDGEVASSKDPRSTAALQESYTSQQALALFNHYSDPDDSDVISPEGFEKLCTESGISLEGALPLILAWQLKASEMGKFTRAEWIQGTSALEISSLPILAQALKELEDLLILDKEPLKYTTPTAAPIKKRGNTAKSVAQEPYNRARYWTYLNDRKAGFSELYQFCFVLAKPPQGRNIDIETAIAFWSVLLSPRYPIMSNIIEFLNAKGTYKGANKDLWSMMLEFCRTVDPSLKDYEADGAWPTLLDDFVAWKKSQTTAANNADATDVEME